MIHIGKLASAHIRNIANMKDINQDFVFTDDFITNENGNFCIKGLTEEERLDLYKNNGFDKLYENLNSKFEARKRKQEEEERKKAENINKVKEYISDRLLTIGTVRGDELVEASANLTEEALKDIVMLYKKEVSNDRKNPLYEIGLLNVPVAQKKVNSGILVVEVPKELVSYLNSKDNYNIINKLRDKGVIVSRALLYKGVPKEKNDFKGNNKQSDGINLATIGKALDNQKKIHD